MALRHILRRSFTTAEPELKQAEKVFSTIDQYLAVSPAPKPSLIVLGPSKSGKSTLIDLVSANLVNVGAIRAELYAEFPATEYISVNDENVDFEQTIGVGATAKSLFDAYEKLEPDSAIKSDFKELLYKHAQILSEGYASREIPELATEEEKESIYKQDNTMLNEINRKLDSYKKVIKIKSFSQSALEHIIDRVTVGDAVEIMHQSCIGLLIDKNFGENSTALLVESLDLLGDICNRLEYPCPVIRFEDAQLMYRTPMLNMYTDHLMKALKASKKNFHCVMEGTGVFGESLKMLKNSEDFQVTVLDDFDQEETFSLIESEFQVKLTTEEKQKIWRISGGNQGILYQISQALDSKEITLDSIEAQIKSNAVTSINSKLLNFKLDEPSEERTFKEKMLNIDFPELRAVIYFLYNLTKESSKSIKIPIQDAANNIIIQELCMHKILFYNPSTEIIKFDKLFLPEVLKECEVWNFTEGTGSNYKNKVAYDRILKESLESLESDN